MKFKGLLWETLKVQSHSGQCEEMQIHVLKYLEKFNITNVTTDSLGNIVATKGNADYYPTFVAHMDTVHRILPRKQYKPSWREDRIDCPTGIGGDDKVGIAAALWLLKNVPVAKAIFTVDEEVGAVGANGLNDAHLANVGYMLQTDRRGNNDIVTDYMGSRTGSEEFFEVVLPAAKRNGYVEASGAFTDVMILGEAGDISVVNISSGYHDPHSSREYVLVSEATHTLNFMFELYNLLETGKKYNHKWENNYNWRYTGNASVWDKEDFSFPYEAQVAHNARSIIEHLYDTTYNAVYEWVLYYLQIDDEVLQAFYDDARSRGYGIKQYLLSRFEKQIRQDLIDVGYSELEVHIHLEQNNLKLISQNDEITGAYYEY